MAAKRALVVDDSKSARAFLARLLKEQQVEVDAAESAEQAIEYLNSHSPDVIFMDHLMPGMDGFQAVQAIKGNPRTAMIPILMYTSQEGELYLGQARALGAVGVLPKSVSSTDVRMVLQQLQMTDAPPAMASREEHAAALAEVPTIELPTADAGPTFDELFKEEAAALRRHLAEALDTHSQQVVREVRRLIPEAQPLLPETPRHRLLPWAVALAASFAAAVFGALLWQGGQQLGAMRAELMDSRSTVALLTARLGPVPQAALPAAAVRSVDAQELKVPFGEAPLSGSRMQALREFVTRAATLGQKGTVEVRYYAGRFCLSGGGAAPYLLADAAVPASQCDVVAEGTDPVLGNASPESAAFAASLAELRKKHAGLLTIDVAAASGDVPGSSYPQADGTSSQVPTAGEWNAVAAGNNRVEIRWQPT
ncbi:MAG: response regulator [Steroidobacteraceae bacterium]